MDILHLVDRLEELFNESRAIPLTHQVVVDEDRMWDLVDQMRVSIPEEVKKAQELISRKDRIMAQAQEEANRTLQLAREKSEQFIERDSIVQAAHTKAEKIIEDAKTEAEETRREADAYVVRTLGRLHLELERIINQVQNGIQMVEDGLIQEPEEFQLQADGKVQDEEEGEPKG